MTTPDAMLANLLAEVKLADKKLEQIAEKRTATENSIRAALRSGDRPAAEKLALHLERIKDEQKRYENQRAQAKQAYETGKVKIRDLKVNMKAARSAKATADALGGVLDAHATLKGADDVLRQIEQDVAMTEARLEIAADEADAVIEPQLDPKLVAESILAEFEEPAQPAPQGEASSKQIGPASEAPPSKQIGPGEAPPPGTGKSIG